MYVCIYICIYIYIYTHTYRAYCLGLHVEQLVVAVADAALAQGTNNNQ